MASTARALEPASINNNQKQAGRSRGRKVKNDFVSQKTRSSSSVLGSISSVQHLISRFAEPYAALNSQATMSSAKSEADCKAVSPVNTRQRV